METIIYNWKERIKKEELENTIKVLNNGGIVIFPTDTVYGIACDAFNETAIKKLFEFKERNNNKPICVLTTSTDKINKVAYIKEKEEELINKYMPGALTIILEKKENVSNILTSNLPTIGVRIPNNEIALKILENVDNPLAATSANLSGSQAGIEINDFIKEFKNKVDIIIDGGETELKISSTIIKLNEDKVEVLREGIVKIEE